VAPAHPHRPAGPRRPGPPGGADGTAPVLQLSLVDLGETELLGCVQLHPSQAADVDAEISWWVVDWLVDGPIDRVLDTFVPAWIIEGATGNDTLGYDFEVGQNEWSSPYQQKLTA
jgi:hypothetical protein